MGHYDSSRPGYCSCGAAPGNIRNGVCDFCGPTTPNPNSRPIPTLSESSKKLASTRPNLQSVKKGSPETKLTEKVISVKRGSAELLATQAVALAQRGLTTLKPYKVYITTMETSSGKDYFVTIDSPRRDPNADVFDQYGRMYPYSTKVLEQAQYTAKEWADFFGVAVS